MTHFNLAASVDYFFNFFLMKGVLVTIGLTVAGVVGGLILGMGNRTSPPGAVVGRTAAARRHCARALHAAEDHAH
jgi:hypothetical protein